MPGTAGGSSVVILKRPLASLKAVTRGAAPLGVVGLAGRAEVAGPGRFEIVRSRRRSSHGGHQVGVGLARRQHHSRREGVFHGLNMGDSFGIPETPDATFGDNLGSLRRRRLRPLERLDAAFAVPGRRPPGQAALALGRCRSRPPGQRVILPRRPASGPSGRRAAGPPGVRGPCSRCGALLCCPGSAE